ncbi:MAG: aminotransferase class IV [Pseudomonadota bacterium]
MEQIYTYIDGEYYREQDAKISIFDHIVHYGDGVFDTCCAINGKIFKLDQHVDRFYRSAHAINISIPLSKQEFKDAIIETVHRCKLQDAFIKPIVTRGVGPQPLLDPRNCKPSVIIIVRPYLYLVDRQKIETGIKWKTSSIRRIPDQCLESKIKRLQLLKSRFDADGSIQCRG